MSTRDNQRRMLEELIRSSRLDWMIEMYAPKRRAVDDFLDALDQAPIEYERQFGRKLSFSLDVLAAEVAPNPQRVAAFLQALSATRSPLMLAMVWRILEGNRIGAVSLEYRSPSLRSYRINPDDGTFKLIITLESMESDQNNPVSEVFESNDVFDAKLLRHFGIAKTEGRPLFDGFDALTIS